MIDVFLFFLTVYVIFYIPIQLWVSKTKYNSLQADYSSHVKQLKYENEYYIGQIQDYRIESDKAKKELERMSYMRDFYITESQSIYDKLERIEDYFYENDIEAKVYDDIMEIIQVDEEETDD